MKDYLESLTQHFGTSATLAQFMGVSVHTVYSWRQGKSTPRGADLRMLEVLGKLVLNAPELLACIVPPRERVPRLPELPPVKQGPYAFPRAPLSPELRAIARGELPELPPVAPPVERERRATKWDDAYFGMRTVADPDDDPIIRQSLSQLRALSDAEEDRFWEACNAYCRRTGRHWCEPS